MVDLLQIGIAAGIGLVAWFFGRLSKSRSDQRKALRAIRRKQKIDDDMKEASDEDILDILSGRADR